MISMLILLVPNINCHYLLTTTDSINSHLNQRPVYLMCQYPYSSYCMISIQCSTNLHWLLRSCWHLLLPRCMSNVSSLHKGKMNRIDRSLEMRTWMKVNAGPLRDTDFV